MPYSIPCIALACGYQRILHGECLSDGVVRDSAALGEVVKAILKRANQVERSDGVLVIGVTSNASAITGVVFKMILSINDASR